MIRRLAPVAVGFLLGVVVTLIAVSEAQAGTRNCKPAWKCQSPAPTVVVTAAPTVNPTTAPTAAPTGTTYTFIDEFDGTTLGPLWENPNHGYFLGDSQMILQNATVANGVLSLKATRNTTGSGPAWLGAGIDTYGLWTQKYGYFEARISIPKGYGIWPAFWVSQSYEVSGPAELDVAEVCANPIGTRGGLDASLLVNTVHFSGGGQSGGSTRTVDLSLDWHVYAMDWRADHVAFFLDGAEVWRYTGTNVPAVAMPMIFDLAVGGSWCGASDATTPSPSVMLVDFVRVRP